MHVCVYLNMCVLCCYVKKKLTGTPHFKYNCEIFASAASLVVQAAAALLLYGANSVAYI